ncbi:MAG: phosphotransferase [Burkholderiales bacterium]|nr:phosphotransferase [Burkholderiales bacterium]
MGEIVCCAFKMGRALEGWGRMVKFEHENDNNRRQVSGDAPHRMLNARVFPPGDPREAPLVEWLTSTLGTTAFELAPAAADASFRRYFRISGLPDGETRIVMDAPPPQEDCRPYVRIAGMLRDAGLNAPRIFATDVERGFLLIEDLGHQTYLQALTDDNADELFLPALDALVRWQLASRPGELPEYDEAVLDREIQLFPDWYIARHLGITLTPAQHDTLQSQFALIKRRNLAQAKVYVHRDYMPRNLMVSDPAPGVLDFQDALHGPISYDVACLFKDAFISWDEDRVLDWTIRYWEKAKKAGLPVPGDFASFFEDVEWMGLQRHLKVAGIFARINYRDGKPQYLADTPRFMGYIHGVAGRYDALSPLLRLLNELEAREVNVGYTF